MNVGDDGEFHWIGRFNSVLKLGNVVGIGGDRASRQWAVR